MSLDPLDVPGAFLCRVVAMWGQNKYAPKAFERLAPMVGGGLQKVTNDGRWECAEERKESNSRAARPTAVQLQSRLAAHVETPRGPPPPTHHTTSTRLIRPPPLPASHVESLTHAVTVRVPRECFNTLTNASHGRRSRGE